MNTELIKIKDVEIKCSVSDNEILIPIKPFCELLGVNYVGQIEKIKEHPILAELYKISYTTGADGKNYKMGCLPLQYFFGWLFTINPKNVPDEIRDNVITYQKECFNVLYDHFFSRANFVIEKQQLIIAQQEVVFNAQNNLKEEKKKLASYRSMDFDVWRLERDQLSLFPEKEISNIG